MLILGISFQLAAGIVFGLPHILGEDRLRGAEEGLRRFLRFPSEGRLRFRVPILGALITPLAFVLIGTILEERVAPTGLRWFQTLGGGLIGSLIVAVFYLYLLRRLAQLISRTNDPKGLPDNAYFQILLRSNLILLPVLGGLGWLSLWGGSALAVARTGSAPEAVVLVPAILLWFLGATSVLSAWTSASFVVLAGIIKLASVMARPRKLLWIIVLSMYVLGGALLIASACHL